MRIFGSSFIFEIILRLVLVYGGLYLLLIPAPSYLFISSTVCKACKVMPSFSSIRMIWEIDQTPESLILQLLQRSDCKTRVTDRYCRCDWTLDWSGHMLEEVEARLMKFLMLLLLLPCAITIELATLVWHRVIFFKVLDWYNYVSIYFACHLSEDFFIEWCFLNRLWLLLIENALFLLMENALFLLVEDESLIPHINRLFLESLIKATTAKCCVFIMGLGIFLAAFSFTLFFNHTFAIE